MADPLPYLCTRMNEEMNQFTLDLTKCGPPPTATL